MAPMVSEIAKNSESVMFFNTITKERPKFLYINMATFAELLESRLSVGIK